MAPPRRGRSPVVARNGVPGAERLQQQQQSRRHGQRWRRHRRRFDDSRQHHADSGGHRPPGVRECSGRRQQRRRDLYPLGCRYAERHHPDLGHLQRASQRHRRGRCDHYGDCRDQSGQRRLGNPGRARHPGDELRPAVPGQRQCALWSGGLGRRRRGKFHLGPGLGFRSAAARHHADGQHERRPLLPLQAPRAVGRVASQAMTMVVHPQASCLLTGRYTFIVTGFRGGGPMTHAGSISVDDAGNISGEQDYKDGHRTTSQEALTPGVCVNRQTNSGQITLNAASGPMNYNFSVTPPDAQGNINAARVQLIGSGADSASGALARLDTTAITAAPPTGNFAFGLITVANQEPYTVHSGSAGRFTSSSVGNISAGQIDSNASPALAGAALGGALSAPDSNGRGTASFVSPSQTSTLVYYMINAGKMYLMDIDPTVGTPRSTGFLTAQIGNTAGGTFDNAALAAAASIISLWGAAGTAEPISVLSIGRLFNGNATAGTVDAVLDTSNHDTDTAGFGYSAQSYAVASSGRGTLSLSSQGTTRDFAFYLDGIADGYVIEHGSPAGDAGLLEAQYTPTGGVYPDTLPGLFVGGTQYAQTPGPIVLVPGIGLNFGVLSSTYTSGTFAIDTSNGRGFGSLSQSGIATSAAVSYVVSPTKVDIKIGRASC